MRKERLELGGLGKPRRSRPAVFGRTAALGLVGAGFLVAMASATPGPEIAYALIWHLAGGGPAR